MRGLAFFMTTLVSLTLVSLTLLLIAAPLVFFGTLGRDLIAFVRHLNADLIADWED